MDSHPAYRPKRHLRYEIYSLALVLIAPVGVLVVFPFASLSFHAAQEAKPVHRQSVCSFVALTEQQVDAAVEAARSAIKTAQDGISALRADLSISAIPAENGGVADVSERKGAPPLADAKYDALPIPPTLAAPPPVRILASPFDMESPPAFSRDDMLEIQE